MTRHPHRLTTDQQLRLAAWLRGAEAELEATRPRPAELASRAADALAFPITTHNITHLAGTLGQTWHRPKPKRAERAATIEMVYDLADLMANLLGNHPLPLADALTTWKEEWNETLRTTRGTRRPGRRAVDGLQPTTATETTGPAASPDAGTATGPDKQPDRPGTGPEPTDSQGIARPPGAAPGLDCPTQD